MTHTTPPDGSRRPFDPDAPWTAHYDAGIPASLAPYPARTLLDYVSEAARLRPDTAALVFLERVFSWADIEHASAAVAAGFADLGVRRGDRVALLLPNCPQFVIAELAIWKLGAAACPLNPLYTETELEHGIARSGATVLVTLTRFYDKVKALQPRTGLRTIVATAIHDYFPTGKRMLYAVAKARREGDTVSIQEGDVRFADLAATAPRALGAPPAPDEPALLLLSGGTTGLPRAVVARHRSLVCSGVQIHTWLASVLQEWDDAVLLPLPLYHVFGAVGVQAFAFVGRNPIVLVPNPRDIRGLVQTIVKVRPAFVAVVPALLNAMLAHPDVKSGRADFRSLKGCFSGAAALLQETRRQFETLTGGVIIEGYSLTEALMACTLNPVRGVNKPGSVGMPLPDVELRIVDEAGTAALPQGEAGEVILRGPQIMHGYWGDPAESAKMLRHFDAGEPWLFTGDIGYLDEEGYLFLIDRKKDLIKVSGMQVWPREVEEAIAAHPAIADVGVASYLDPLKGEQVKAWVVLREGATALDSELRAHCRQRLAPYKVPAQFEFCAALPRNTLGKVLRRELRQAGATQSSQVTADP
jgi:long-chain acyl-CoA synthetase